MDYILSSLSNREKSIIIWILFGFIVALFTKDGREAVLSIFKTAFSGPLGSLFLLIILWTLLIVVFLQNLGYWEPSLIKGTVIWIFGFAFYMFFKYKQIDEPNLIKRIFRESFKVTIIISFISNFYVFDLIGELFFISSILLVSFMTGISSIKEKYNVVEKVLNKLIILISFVLLGYTIYQMIKAPHLLFTLLNLKEFTLPLILTIAYLPFLYLMVLYLTYKSLFLRLNYFFEDKNLITYAKRRLIWKCNLSLNKIKTSEKNVFGLYVESKEEVAARI